MGHILASRCCGCAGGRLEDAARETIIAIERRNDREDKGR